MLLAWVVVSQGSRVQSGLTLWNVDSSRKTDAS